MFAKPVPMRLVGVRSAGLGVVCAALLTACGSNQSDRNNGNAARDREVLDHWLLCEECTNRELDSLLAPGRRDRMVPLLDQALQGPALSRRENVRRQLEETYARLADRANRENRTVPLTRDEYVSHFLSNYEAVYQSRAITGLKAIGSPAARQVLGEALDRSRQEVFLYRGDVVDELIRAAPSSWASISAGVLRTCGIRPDGKAYCWGQNDLGQLGNGTTLGQSTPALVAGNLNFTSIVTGAGFHTCGIAGHRVYCWGSNVRGELGDGTTANHSVPTAVRGNYAFVGVAVGGNHACAWTPSYQAYCWGGNNAGQLGNGNTEAQHQLVALPDAFRFRSISAGAMHTCANSLGGRLYCWGSNRYGQLGNKSATDSPIPVPIAGGLRFTAPSLGGFHSCALREGAPSYSAAYCAGNNGNGRLGDGSIISRDSLVEVAGGYRFVAISAGADHTCGITQGSRSLRCWGANTYGQLGDGSNVDRNVPVPVLGARPFAVISAGAGHTCGITTDGEAYCWGRNTAGQLGDSTMVNRSTPTLVRTP